MTEHRDPHDPDVQWRYDPKWGLQCRGEHVLRGIHRDAWSWGGADTFVPTAERITLWYTLMRQATDVNV